MSQNKSVEQMVNAGFYTPQDRLYTQEEVNTLLHQERQTSQEREREIVETRICNRVGVHTCRANAIHIPFRFCGKIEDLLTNPNKE